MSRATAQNNAEYNSGFLIVLSSRPQSIRYQVRLSMENSRLTGSMGIRSRSGHGGSFPIVILVPQLIIDSILEGFLQINSIDQLIEIHSYRLLGPRGFPFPRLRGEKQAPTLG